MAQHEGSGSWVEEDEAIMGTNSEAAECKRCAVQLGYWKDEYIKLFARHVDRKPPEINRGYYTRVKAMEHFIHQFLERCGSKCQIINLGCGFDTLYWRLKEHTSAIGNFIEIDLPSVTAKKINIIKRHKQLLEKITIEEGAMSRTGELHSQGYHVVGADLRCVESVERALTASGALGVQGQPPPTLLLAECVLVYLRPEAARRLLALLAGRLPHALLLQYEQCNLGDRFGAQMASSLAERGCPVWAGAGGADAAAQRLKEAGWPHARAWPLGAVAQALPLPPAAALAADPLDEPELLRQLHEHYAFAAASTGDLFADLDLPNE